MALGTGVRREGIWGGEDSRDGIQSHPQWCSLSAELVDLSVRLVEGKTVTPHALQHEGNRGNLLAPLENPHPYVAAVLWDN